MDVDSRPFENVSEGSESNGYSWVTSKLCPRSGAGGEGGQVLLKSGGGGALASQEDNTHTLWGLWNKMNNLYLSLKLKWNQNVTKHQFFIFF